MKKVPFRLDDQRRPQEQVAFKLVNLERLKVHSYLGTLSQTHHFSHSGCFKNMFNWCL